MVRVRVRVGHRLLHRLGGELEHTGLASLGAVDECVGRADRRLLRRAVVAEAPAGTPRLRAATALGLGLLVRVRVVRVWVRVWARV